ncbi:hypothetical protein ACFQ3Z_04920 [Streptomyces nogalater]
MQRSTSSAASACSAAARSSRAPVRRYEIRGVQLPCHLDGGGAGTIQQLGDPAVQLGAGCGVHVLQDGRGGGGVPEGVTVKQPGGVEDGDGFLGAGGRGAGQLRDGGARCRGAERGEGPGHPDLAASPRCNRDSTAWR